MNHDVEGVMRQIRIDDQSPARISSVSIWAVSQQIGQGWKYVQLSVRQ
jgi:hypothetical protein